MSSSDQIEVPAVKDGGQQRPVPTVWRYTLEQIVRAFAKGDYELRDSIPLVKPIAAKVALRMRGYVQDYPATLVDLPQQAWESSVSQWMDGYWDVLVDLWTAESGPSDLALSARVYEDGDSFRIEVQGIYVP